MLKLSLAMGMPSFFELMVFSDLLHLLENTFDRNVYFCSLTLTLKHSTVFKLMKWRHFSSKCTDRYLAFQYNARMNVCELVIELVLVC